MSNTHSEGGRVVDDTGCEHDFQPYDTHHKHRRKCTKCGVFGFVHHRHERTGALPKLYCCSYTKMVDTTNGEKRRPGCCAPAKAWYSESPYCIAHVPIPRGQAEEQRRLEAERKREEDARKVLRSFDDDRSEVAPSNLTHIPDDHMITRDRNGNVIEVPDPLAF